MKRNKRMSRTLIYESSYCAAVYGSFTRITEQSMLSPTTLEELERKLGIDEHKAIVLGRKLTGDLGWAVAQ